MPPTTWTHLAATYDGSTQKLYVNGELLGSRPQAGTIAISGGKLRIGGNSIWGEYFTGHIDEVRIYNRALTQAEFSSDSKLAVVGLVVSTKPDCSGSVPLNGLPVSGNIYISYKLISPTATANPVKQVKFWLDNPQPSSPTGTPRQTEAISPYDFAGTLSDGTAAAFNTAGLSKGLHRVTAQVTLSDGTVLLLITGSFALQWIDALRSSRGPGSNLNYERRRMVQEQPSRIEGTAKREISGTKGTSCVRNVNGQAKEGQR